MLKIMSSLLSLILSIFLSGTYAQFVEIPPIACPDYFQYLGQGGKFIGKLTLPNIQLGWTTVEVHFSQRVPLETDYVGNITLYPDETTINGNKQNTQAISYHIEFPNNDVLPKLTQIAVNTRVLCSTSEYKPPSTSFIMQHTVRVTIKSIENPRSVELRDADIPNPEPQPTKAPDQNQAQVIPAIQPIQSLSSQRHSYLKAVCGQEGTEHSGGAILRRGEYPWLAVIYQKDPIGVKYISGGSLISSRTIVTAAHYFRRNSLMAEDISVFLGRYNLSDPLEDSFVQRDIKTLLIHPEYKSGYHFPDADIALLQLLAPVGFTQFIRPICLWNDDTDDTLIGQSAIVAGWDIIDEYRTSLLLPKKVDANVVPDDQCLWSSPAYYALTSSRTFCAGKRDRTGPCGGGNGLMLNRNGRWVLRAVVSAGLAEGDKCDLTQYVVYCDIGKHSSWIKSYMQT